MMNKPGGMMEGMGGMMMWGMGIFWLLTIVLLALAIAALAKYLLTSNQRGDRDA